VETTRTRLSPSGPYQDIAVPEVRAASWADVYGSGAVTAGATPSTMSSAVATASTSGALTAQVDLAPPYIENGGAETIDVEVHASLSIECTEAAQTVTAYLYLDGAPVVGAEATETLDVASSTYNLAICRAQVRLNPGGRLDLYFDNETAQNNLIVTSFSFAVKEHGTVAF